MIHEHHRRFRMVDYVVYGLAYRLLTFCYSLVASIYEVYYRTRGLRVIIISCLLNGQRRWDKICKCPIHLKISGDNLLYPRNLGHWIAPPIQCCSMGAFPVTFSVYNVTDRSKIMNYLSVQTSHYSWH